MKSTTITFKANEDTKKQFQELCEKLDFSVSMALNMFMSTAVRQQSFNFLDLSLKDKTKDE